MMTSNLRKVTESANREIIEAILRFIRFLDGMWNYLNPR